ncbi:lytic transglycosylase domain-containing protein [Erythrobacter sp. HKB08]|uniref:lytic transglycosylase domain-containing protein n=1 Tax=Erythrobacter sp. HKB08 TaxID=2502843 RepID=UPI0010091447|nr:lytic transglycosylase domain-containing protein [Erythrobacter sp. HKB08]
MSSMDRLTPLVLAAIAAPALAASAPLAAQDAASWDRARAEMIARAPSGMARAIDRWEHLTQYDNLGFEAYADFILAYPGFPREELLQRRAENALSDEPIEPNEVVAFFDKNPPVTNAGRARYALALAALSRPEALQIARSAWRGGTMSGPSELYLEGLYGLEFTGSDHRARMDALLWQENLEAATRQISRISDENQPLYEARLNILAGRLEQAGSMRVSSQALSDPGFVYNLAKHYRETRQLPQAINLLTTRPKFTSLPFDAEDFVGEMLRVARGAGASQATRIAASVDDLFEPGEDISKLSYRLRDDYTSLMWLGGTKALWSSGDAGSAAPLFYRYGAAAQTPQTRSKGFYWAGLAAQRAGQMSEANRYYEMAAGYPDRFYGQLALEKLGRPVPKLNGKNAQEPTAEQRAAFREEPLTRAVAEVSRGASWRLGIQFYREIAQQADTEAEHMLVTELARDIGRRDLAVNVAEAAGADGHDQFVAQGFPTLPNPPGTYWTMVHAIARQESQFAQNAISHAGARGLMQLMPGTAREEAGKQGRAYMSADLIDSPSYNMQLGNGYFARMLDYYDGSYPLAIAAYNAGPGNVNKWLRSNGDPRNGGIDWVTWIERIPIYETKNYVQRVIENAATYEQLYPERARNGRPRVAGDFLR